MNENHRKISPRPVTDAEAAHFQEQGWVTLRRFFTPEECCVLLDRVKELMGHDAETVAHPTGSAKIGFFHTFEPLAVEQSTGKVADALFHEVSFSSAFGRAGARLAGEPVRYWVDGALVKMPAASSKTGAGPTTWHTDVGAWESSPFNPRSRGPFQFWVALCDVPHHRGTMRFVGKQSQTEEAMKIVAEHEGDPVATYPLLEKLGVLSPRLDLQAGDATVHASSTLHSAYPNLSDEPRWVYINSMFSAAARYTGHSFWPIEGIQGMEVGKEFADYRFPVLA
ncbi:MAG TPA: phytanoyl-CoA dioxygenase family protein [Steroidobacteraceae bacterium]|nr:phytanoyl-CoA dioxygenase family protein [Steroidobacteraceae bacterium]